jgi:hypothetical protein
MLRKKNGTSAGAAAGVVDGVEEAGEETVVRSRAFADSWDTSRGS